MFFLFCFFGIIPPYPTVWVRKKRCKSTSRKLQFTCGKIQSQQTDRCTPTNLIKVSRIVHRSIGDTVSDNCVPYAVNIDQRFDFEPPGSTCFFTVSVCRCVGVGEDRMEVPVQCATIFVFDSAVELGPCALQMEH